VGVLPDYQRQGIGSELVREGLRRGESGGYGAVVVLGDPRFYSRFGFVRAANYGLRNEYGMHDEFMVMELRENALSGVSGVVQYAREFSIVS
jgi:putative acetyltransferase